MFLKTKLAKVNLTWLGTIKKIGTDMAFFFMISDVLIKQFSLLFYYSFMHFISMFSDFFFILTTS